MISRTVIMNYVLHRLLSRPGAQPATSTACSIEVQKASFVVIPLFELLLGDVFCLQTRVKYSRRQVQY